MDANARLEGDGGALARYPQERDAAHEGRRRSVKDALEIVAKPKEDQMKVWGVTVSDIAQAESDAGVRVKDLRHTGKALQFTLKTEGYPPRWGRRSGRINKDGSLRRVPGAVCWHGHRAFIRALLTLAPDARIKTGLADYRGLRHFEETHEATWGKGNYYGFTYGQVCDCNT